MGKTMTNANTQIHWLSEIGIQIQRPYTTGFDPYKKQETKLEKLVKTLKQL
jgi:hypothetical protein